MRMSMPSFVDHLDERFIHKEVQFRIFGLTTKISQLECFFSGPIFLSIGSAKFPKV